MKNVLIVVISMEPFFIRKSNKKQKNKCNKDPNVSVKQADEGANSRERHRKGESLSQVHAHEGHVGDAVDRRRTPDDQEEHFSEPRGTREALTARLGV